MDPSSPFEDRRKGLEEAFFHQRDQALLDKLRQDLQSLDDKQKLAEVSGLTDDHVLTSLVQAGVRAETLTAVGLVPLVEVAWCDGAVSPEERDAVLNAAAAQGVRADSAAYGVLRQWLDKQPDPKIAAAWRDYVRALAHGMPKTAVAAMRDKVMDRAHRVAAAAGGFLGIATVSQHERAKIEELSKAWDG